MCLFPDVACGMPEDDLMFSEDEDLEDLSNGQTSHPQLKTPAADGLLSLNRLVGHYPRRNVMQVVHWLLILSDNDPNLFQDLSRKLMSPPHLNILITLPSHCVTVRVISPCVGAC